MGTLTIRLDDKLEGELARLAKRTGRAKSDLAARRCASSWPFSGSGALRRRALPYAGAAGYLTDEDVFRDVS